MQWMAVLVVFALGQVFTLYYDTTLAAGYGLLVGLPLACAFSKAVVFRVYGIPLRWRELRSTMLRAAATTATAFGLLVVALILIGVAVLLLVFSICGGAIGMGRL